ERNVSLYCQLGLPFVLGTTGGDRSFLESNVKESETSAVIAPNMAPQIVGFQAMMEYAAQQFSGLFQGYELRIVESHQSSKADTSGTAKAMVKYFDPLGAKNGLGDKFEEKHIIKERDRDRQRAIWQIEEKYLDGHAWHVYDLISPDGTVIFNFQHKVNGRQIYCDGVYMAIKFLHQKIQEGSSGKVFSMIDVLKLG
ncbi:dihydrodipicolinate reductase, partial [bacterium]|nr:dihydrodipicolinate reductase [bacterium]